MDIVDDLNEIFQGIKVRSESSQQRLLNDSESDDSTYEASTESISSEEDFDMEDEEFEVYVPIAQEQDIDGQSDYQGSDDGDGELVERGRRKDWLSQRAMGIAKVLEISTFWITTVAIFSQTERRWVNKGPVLVFFSNESKPRLMGTFLYGTKSYCIDMELYEHFEVMLKNYNNNVCQFSSFGYQASRHCETLTEKVPLQTFFPHVGDHALPVYRCTSRVYSVQENSHTLFSIKFLDHSGTF